MDCRFVSGCLADWVSGGDSWLLWLAKWMNWSASECLGSVNWEWPNEWVSECMNEFFKINFQHLLSSVKFILAINWKSNVVYTHTYIAHTHRHTFLIQFHLTFTQMRLHESEEGHGCTNWKAFMDLRMWMSIGMPTWRWSVNGIVVYWKAKWLKDGQSLNCYGV